MATEPFIVMGIDPGLATGAALVSFSTPDGCELLEAAELEFEEVMPWGDMHMASGTRLVVERFIINPRTVKNSQAPWSLEVIGVVRAMAGVNGLNVEMQNAADAKSTVDNPMIRRLGLWYRGGEGHALDAIRHTVTYAIRQGWRDPRLLSDDA